MDHPNTQIVMDRLDFSRFDIIDHPVRANIIEDIQLIVNSKLKRYDKTAKRVHRARKNNRSLDPTERAVDVVQGLILWNSHEAAIRNHQLGLPEPKFTNALELIRHTADYYRK